MMSIRSWARSVGRWLGFLDGSASKSGTPRGTRAARTTPGVEPLEDRTLPAAQPNVVVIMTDDLDNRLFADALRLDLMPAVEEHLVGRGVTFSNSFVTNSLCCPSRATFLTGQYSHNHGIPAVKGTSPGKKGITWWRDQETSPEVNTLPVWLHDAGYRTGLIGKYLNGYGEGDATSLTIPPGYDDWHALFPGGEDLDFFVNGVVESYGPEPENYQTDVIARKAVDFLEQYETDDRPFFLELTPTAPHVGGRDHPALKGFGNSIDPAPRHQHLLDDYRDAFEPAPSFNEADVSDKPHVAVKWQSLTGRQIASVARRQYPGRLLSLMAIDDLVGSVVAELQRQDLLDSTYLFFTSDNGFFHGEHRLTGKWYAYEESIRVPLIVSGPGVAAGVTSDRLVVNNDLAPTIAAAGGVTPGLDVDGRSLLPLLEDPAGATWTRVRFLVEGWSVWPSRPVSFAAIRTLTATTDTLYIDWFAYAAKFPFNVNAQPRRAEANEFYNLRSDPFQMRGRGLRGEAATAAHQMVLRLRVSWGAQARHWEDALDG